jgi:hypothetical protein
MHFLPELDQRIEVFSRHDQNLADIRTPRIIGTDRVSAIRDRYSSISSQFDDEFCLTSESVDMTGRVILWISYEEHSTKPSRRHS